MSIFESYEEAINEALKYSPTIYLDELLNDKDFISAIEVTKIVIELEKIWKKHKKLDVKLGIIISEKSQSSKIGSIFNYKFEKDIENIIQNGNSKSYIYTIDKSGQLLDKNSHEKLTLEKMTSISYCTKSIAFYLGIIGIDALVDGKPFKISNHLDSYSDMINIELLKSIDKYKELLQEFFYDRVQYDPYNQYFIQKSRYSKSIHHLLDKHPKALYSKPEQIFQKDLIYFLRNKCKDTILKEVHNAVDERYDIWVLTNDKKLYVFEIKWLGKSISPEGKIFYKYNTSERAIEGAYQLKDYIDNAENYSHLKNGHRIYCGILVTFDAREIMDNIEFDEVFNDYPQLDLKQHFKIEKDKIKASQVYYNMKKMKSN